MNKLFFEEYFPEERDELHFNRYKKFILSRHNKNKYEEGYFETQHILPVAYKENIPIGENIHNKNNLITITAREHYIAHLMLWKAFGGKMAQAFFMMTSFSRYESKLTSRQYSSLREAYSKIISKRFKGKKRSEEENKNIREGIRKVCCTEEFSSKMSAVLTERYSSKDKRDIQAEASRKAWDKDNRKQRFSEARKGEGNPCFGRVPTTEQRDNFSEKMKDRVWINNSVKNMFIKKDTLDNFLSSGWKKGRLQIAKETCPICGRYISNPNFEKHYKACKRNHDNPKVKTRKGSTTNRVWIHFDDKRKLVKKEDLDNYLNSGWSLGRKNEG